jgi:hypothetical protein
MLKELHAIGMQERMPLSNKSLWADQDFISKLKWKKELDLARAGLERGFSLRRS